MAKKTMYSFAEKRHPASGIISAVMGGISLLFFVAMVVVSYYKWGRAGIYAGAFGLSGMIFALAGFILGIASFSEKDIKYKYPKLGSILSGVMFVVWLGLYLMGI